MTAPPDPSPRLRTTWTHEGFTCEVDGSGSVGPMLLLLGIPAVAVAAALVVPAPATVLAVPMALPVAYFASTRWAAATLRPIEVGVERGRLRWQSGWQATVEIDLAEVFDVRVRRWGLALVTEDGVRRLFSPSRVEDLDWLATRLREAAWTARDIATELQDPAMQRQRTALDALRAADPEPPTPR
ncbi:MAG: hypothetical protein AAF602_24255 [Myxococcota bacterium]